MKNIDMLYQLPKYWNILDDMDKQGYAMLRATFCSHFTKCQRNRRIENFTEILNLVNSYCIRKDANDWKRCLACGYCSFKDGIAINNTQFKILTFKCKSSINGSLNKIGLHSNVPRNDSLHILYSAMPILKDNAQEARNWSVRVYGGVPSDKEEKSSSDDCYDSEKANSSCDDQVYNEVLPKNEVKQEVTNQIDDVINDFGFNEDYDLWNVDLE